MSERPNEKRVDRLRAAASRFFPLFLLAASAALFVGVLYWRLAPNAPTDGPEGGASTEKASRRDVADSLKVETGERKAFLVAADDYGSKASALPGAKRDVEALRARLLEIGFEERNVVTLQTARTDTGAVDYDFLPEKSKIERRFKAFVDNLKPGDFAFVFLSGHGVEAPQTNEAFFVPIDFDPEKPLATSVSVDAMTAALAKSAAKFRWFAVDACRSRSSEASSSPVLFASRSADAAPLSEIANVPASVVMLQSCRSGQSSYEGGLGEAKEIANGFFTLSLLEALDAKESKADANKDGVASFLEICRYVATRTDDLAQTYYKKEQTPTLSGADITDFPFLTGLLVDGLTYDAWKRANAAFEEAKALRRAGEYEAALDKIAAARQIAPENETYRVEETELRQLADAAGDASPTSEKTPPSPTPEEAKARYLAGRRAAWGLDGTNVYELLAFQALKEAAENGCVEAAGELARLYLSGGAGMKVDCERARFWAEKGAKADDPTALMFLATAYYLGRGVEPDDEKAEALGRSAFEGFRRLAESGDVVASYWLGVSYCMGIGVEKNDAEAARYFQDASEANLPAATRDLGLLYLCGRGVEKNAEEGARLLRVAAERGDRYAPGLLAYLLATGDGVERDEKAAWEWGRRAVERGDCDGVGLLGFWRLNGLGDVESDAAYAFEYFLKAANLGSPEACELVGEAYRFGVGVERDEAKAFEWYRKAAELGIPTAAFSLADFYERGACVERDEARANELRRKGFDLASRRAKIGDARGARVVGECYENGVGVEADEERAFEWYSKAAEFGDARAMRNLGDFYREVSALENAATLAFEWYSKAAELGDGAAMFFLASCYENGVGVEADASWAFEWRRKAAVKLGSKEAIENLVRCYEEGIGVPQDQEKANELRRRFDEALEAAGGEESEVKIDLDEFKNDGAPLKPEL